VEETLNALLDAEADRLCNAQRYERSAARRDSRAGHYERGLQWHILGYFSVSSRFRFRPVNRHSPKPHDRRPFLGALLSAAF